MQTYVGKPIGAITPFLAPPKYKNSLGTRTQLVWGNSGVVWQNIGLPIPSRKTCKLTIDVNNAGIITQIEYVNDNFSDQLQDCPQLNQIYKQRYIIQPELYKYDKAHGIVISNYAVPK